MDRSALLSLAAVALVAIGLLASLAPALFMQSNAIDYLRSAAHGRRSTSTSSERPAHVPEHRWRNEAMPLDDASGQIRPPYPDNAGSPAEDRP
jgi:hypothetical protein